MSAFLGESGSTCVPAEAAAVLGLWGITAARHLHPNMPQSVEG